MGSILTAPKGTGMKHGDFLNRETGRGAIMTGPGEAQGQGSINRKESGCNRNGKV